jgi:apolipoprotein N-acyltransferase
MGVLVGITKLAQGVWWHSVVPAVILALYASTYGLILVFSARSLARMHLLKNSAANTVASWTCALWFYCIIVDRFCLLPFDVCEGYTFVNPLIFLSALPELLQFLPLLGKELLLMLVFLPSALTVLYLHTRNRKTLIALCMVLLFWILSVFTPVTEYPRPAWLDHITVVPVVFHRTPHLTLLARNIQKIFVDVIQKHPDTQLIIMPEAAIYCDHLLQKEIPLHWNEAGIGKSVHLIAGAFRWDDDNYRNTCFWIHNGIMQQHFDKRHAVVLTERLPRLLQWDFVHDLYFQKSSPTAASTNVRPLMAIDGVTNVVPYICSELFFNQSIDDAFWPQPILALCNDRWTLPFFRECMLVMAQFKAILWSRPILYISFSHIYYIHVNGKLTPLPVYNGV